MKKQPIQSTYQSGFTIVEMMVALLVSSIVIAAIYATYTVQDVAAIRQEQVADIQSNLRAASYNMMQEIRMAGFNPTEEKANKIAAESERSALNLLKKGQIGILKAEENQIIFTIDLDHNGKIDGNNEIVEYKLVGKSLKRATGKAGSLQTMAEGIEALEFLYLIDDGASGGILKTNPSATDLENIRSITLSMFGIAKNDPNYNGEQDDFDDYVPCSLSKDGNLLPRDTNGEKATLQGSATKWIKRVDFPNYKNQRKRMVMTTIKCRNMGLLQ